MESKARIKALGRDYPSGNIEATIVFDEDVASALEVLQTKELTCVLKQFTRKRSLDSNAYFHLLCGKIAAALGVSIDRAKNELLGSYGQYEYIDGKIPTYLIKAEYEADILEKSDIHFKIIGREFQFNSQYVKVAVMRGSHTYNSQEMSQLIAGTVQDAKDLGIETVSPQELQAMAERWQLRWNQ